MVEQKSILARGKKIAILVVPTEQCNMDCVYCYHNPHHEKNRVSMSIETLEQLMKITLPNFDKVSFIWHGGEPLLMGVDFYKEALKLQKKHGKGTIIRNSIQTNLTLLSNEFVDLLVQNKFWVSSSFDGVCNDSTRGNSDIILAKRALLKNKGQEVGNILVLSQKTVYDLIDSYRFFKERKIGYKMNLYIDTVKNDDSCKLSVPSDVYIAKMTELFDYWISDIECNVRVSNFVELLRYFLFGEKFVCCYTSCLGKWLGIRADGSIANCVRFFPNKYLYGSIFDYSDIREAFSSDGFRNMLSDSIKRREKCKGCVIYDYCQGGCSNEALFENGMDNNGGNSCKCRIGLYKYVKEMVDALKEIKWELLDGKYNPYVVKYIKKYQTGEKVRNF